MYDRGTVEHGRAVNVGGTDTARRAYSAAPSCGTRAEAATQPLPTLLRSTYLVLGCSACSCVRYAGLRCTRPGTVRPRGARTGRDYRIRLRWRKRRPHRILYVYAVPIILRVAETKEEGRRLPDPAGPCPCDQRTGAGSRAQPSGGGKIRPSPGSASEISAPVRGTRTPVW